MIQSDYEYNFHDFLQVHLIEEIEPWLTSTLIVFCLTQSKYILIITRQLTFIPHTVLGKSKMWRSINLGCMQKACLLVGNS